MVWWFDACVPCDADVQLRDNPAGLFSGFSAFPSRSGGVVGAVGLAWSSIGPQVDYYNILFRVSISLVLGSGCFGDPVDACAVSVTLGFFCDLSGRSICHDNSFKKSCSA